MRWLQLLLVILSPLFFNSSYAQGNKVLAKKIDSLYEVDQAVQLLFKKVIENNASADSIQLMEAAEKATFHRHIPLLKKIVAVNGYPTIQKVGAGASHRFFALVQHSDSDPAFQSSLLPVLKKGTTKGDVTKKDYAYLYDRVQRNTGKQQLYGTQLSFNSKGNLFDSTDKIIIPKDLADPANVDKRRKEMGLVPLEAYYESVLEAVGRPRRKG